MMQTQDIVSALIASRHPDGGWAYSRRSPRTEPTALAMIALSAAGLKTQELESTVDWLVRRQRSDGGWSPADGVDQSTWVTSLVLLIPGLPAAAHRRGLEWLLQVSSRESTITDRLRRFLLGVKLEAGDGTTGWPFFPETTGWVTPTATAMLALRSAAKRHPDNERIKARLEAGGQFLLARQCSDGGWNHGSSRTLGIDAPSYPETTGQAMLALRGYKSASVDKGLQSAEHHLARAESVEASVWLRLGLLAHSRQSVNREYPPCRGTLDLSLRLIVDAALRGVDVFA